MKKRLPKVMISSRQAGSDSGVIGVPSTAGAPSGLFPTPAGPLGETTNEMNPPFSPPAEMTRARGKTALTHMRAERIVRRHATIAGFGGIIPVPIVNIAGITAVILRMVRMLARLYGVPFERDRARSVVISLLGGTLPTGLGVAASSTLIYLVPGSNLVAMAVSSISAVACTRAIGYIFIDHFETGGTLSEYQ